MLHVSFLNPFNDSCRDTGDDGVVGDIVGDDGTGTDDAAGTDMDIGHDGAIGS